MDATFFRGFKRLFSRLKSGRQGSVRQGLTPRVKTPPGRERKNTIRPLVDIAQIQRAFDVEIAVLEKGLYGLRIKARLGEVF